jgi:small subunit ribosomal protein S17
MAAKNIIKGEVVSDKMIGSISVRLNYRVKDKHVNKIIRRSTKLLVDDKESKAKAGDTVLIEECRPLSKRKRHKLVEVLGGKE